MSTVKLNQIIAVEQGKKRRTHQEWNEIYHGFAKTEPMRGISKTYTPKDEAGDQLPPEGTLIQVNVIERVDRLRLILGELLDVTLTKDAGNLLAIADVEVEGMNVLSKVPVTFLLYLEKQLSDLRTVIGKLPTLDPADKWTFDADQGFYKSDPIQTVRTKKEQQFVVVPGSGVPEKGVAPVVRDVTNDVNVGTWTTVKFAAMYPPSDVAEMVSRIDALLSAVKMARQAANSVEVEQLKCGAAIFGYILDGRVSA